MGQPPQPDPFVKVMVLIHLEAELDLGCAQLSIHGTAAESIFPLETNLEDMAKNRVNGRAFRSPVWGSPNAQESFEFYHFHQGQLQRKDWVTWQLCSNCRLCNVTVLSFHSNTL